MIDKPPQKKELNLWDLSSLGVEFAFIIGIFVFSGNYIDEKFSISPVGILLFTALGFGFGLYYLVKRT